MTEKHITWFVPPGLVHILSDGLWPIKSSNSTAPNPPSLVVGISLAAIILKVGAQLSTQPFKLVNAGTLMQSSKAWVCFNAVEVSLESTQDMKLVSHPEEQAKNIKIYYQSYPAPVFYNPNKVHLNLAPAAVILL